jgi:carbon storage regulator
VLILTRKANQAVVINGNTTVRVLSIDGDRVKLGIDAPPEVGVVRDELLREVAGQNRQAARRGDSAGLADSLRSLGRATGRAAGPKK